MVNFLCQMDKPADLTLFKKQLLDFWTKKFPRCSQEASIHHDWSFASTVTDKKLLDKRGNIHDESLSREEVLQWASKLVFLRFEDG